MNEPNPLPSLCRNVIFVQWNGIPRASIVADVSPERPSRVTLAVFLPRPRLSEGGEVEYAHDVPYDDSSEPSPGTWHYPPRA